MTKQIDVESIDLVALTRELRDACGEGVPGSVVGRTLMRDAVVRALGCSQLEAENLVETLISRGFVVQRADDPEHPPQWLIRAPKVNQG